MSAGNTHIIYKDACLPDLMFRELDPTEKAEFQAWARANMVPDQVAKAHLYHPVVRQVWIEAGLLTILDPATDG